MKTTEQWAAIGINWIAEPVSEVFGENNQSDKREVAIAQLPQIIDIDKAAKGGINILNWLNASNSMRVRAQAIARSHQTLKPDAMREMVFAALLGQRAAGGSRTTVITIRNLPDGKVYDGNDEIEFRQLFMAALIDMGVDGAMAREKAASYIW